MDILLIHLGKSVRNKQDIVLPPLGTLYLAEYLNQHGIDTKIANLNIGQKTKEISSLYPLIKKYDIKILGLPLHWHQQSFNVIDSATKLKKAFPDIKIILGGSTATFFHREIMSNFFSIDFIIRGDAEIPLLNLAKKILEGKKSFYNVPNLTWRQDKTIITNKQSYVCNQKIVNSIIHPNFDSFLKEREFSFEANSSQNRPQAKTTIFNPARGCSGDCPYCGGSKTAQKILYKRKKTLYLSLENGLKTVQKMSSSGINHLYFPFFTPGSKEFYLDLFKKIRQNNINFSATIELYSLCDKEFIEDFSSTFSKESTVVLSPNTGSESLRKKIQTFYYSNNMLIDCLNNIIRSRINLDLQFSTGFPFETKKDLEKTIFLIRYLKRTFPASFSGSSIELEPASLMYLYPKYYKINSKRKNFSDFIEASQKKLLGYSTETFSEKEIILNNQYLKKIYEG